MTHAASSPKAVCTTLAAFSISLSFTGTAVLISLVEIIWTFTPASERAPNILAATPLWLRMPMPTMLSLATPLWVRSLTADKLRDYAERAHAAGLRVKCYYTVRELTNWAPEIFALRSFGGELLAPGKGGGHACCEEHLGGNYWGAWYEPGTNDRASPGK